MTYIVFADGSDDLLVANLNESAVQQFAAKTGRAVSTWKRGTAEDLQSFALKRMGVTL